MRNIYWGINFYLVSRRLYGLGARRVIVTGVGRLGCVPAELALEGSLRGECVGEPQQAKAIYNPLLVQLLQDLNTNVGSHIFISSNAFDMNMDIIDNPKRYGLLT